MGCYLIDVHDRVIHGAIEMLKLPADHPNIEVKLKSSRDTQQWSWDNVREVTRIVQLNVELELPRELNTGTDLL